MLPGNMPQKSSESRIKNELMNKFCSLGSKQMWRIKRKAVGKSQESHRATFSSRSQLSYILFLNKLLISVNYCVSKRGKAKQW